MANYEKVSEDVQKKFDEVLESKNIPHWIQIELLCNNKQKQLYRISKLNDMVEKLTDGINFAISINEEIFDQLPDDLKDIVFDECLAGVSVSDKDVAQLEAPDFSTYTGVLQKYGHESIISLKESVKSLFDAKKQREDEQKAANSGKKGRKRKE
jgi:hypothetical protein